MKLQEQSAQIKSLIMRMDEGVPCWCCPSRDWCMLSPGSWSDGTRSSIPALSTQHTGHLFHCEHLLRIFQDLAAEREQEFAATFGTIKNLKSRSRPDNSSRKEHEDRQTFCLPVVPLVWDKGAALQMRREAKAGSYSWANGKTEASDAEFHHLFSDGIS